MSGFVDNTVLFSSDVFILNDIRGSVLADLCKFLPLNATKRRMFSRSTYQMCSLICRLKYGIILFIALPFKYTICYMQILEQVVTLVW